MLSIDRELAPHERIIVALDVASEHDALALVDALHDRVGVFKIGLELLYSCGHDIVRRLADQGLAVFMDGKFMDIPNTVAAASAAATRLGARMFTVHSMGGAEMVRASVTASERQAATNGTAPPQVLAVTLLTSIGPDALTNELHVPDHVDAFVQHLTRLALSAGAAGVVASPQEISAIREIVPSDFVIVTPGIRPAWASTTHDQRRVSTPGRAIADGASFVVVGRAITQPPSSAGGAVNAAKLIAEEIAAGFESRVRP